MKIVLFLKGINPDSCFHYARKQGGDLKFVYNREKDRHETKFTLEEWRADHFYQGRMLLDGSLVVPIFFDVEEELAQSHKDTKEETPAPQKRSSRKSKQSPEQSEVDNSIEDQKPEIENSEPPPFIPA